jgi:hypothetical protein
MAMTEKGESVMEKLTGSIPGPFLIHDLSPVL